MKKVLSLVLVLVLMCTMFAACGEKKELNPDGTVAKQPVVENDLAYIRDKGTMTVGITEYAPMNYKDESGEWTGFDTEFTKAVAEKLGVDVEFVVLADWDGKIMELDSKSIDCVWNGMTLTDEVLKGMTCSDPYVVNAQVVVAKEDLIDSIKTVDDLEGLELAAEAGSAGESAIFDAGFDCIGVPAQSDALLEVASGSADACVIDITMANAMTGEGTGYESLKSGLSLTEEFYGIGFRKGSDAAAEVNSIIDELIADGTLPALAEKYNLTLAE